MDGGLVDEEGLPELRVAFSPDLRYNGMFPYRLLDEI